MGPWRSSRSPSTVWIDVVFGLSLREGTERSLTAVLNAAVQALDVGNTSAAVGALTAFINQVSALITNGTLTVEVGQGLIDTVNALIDGILTS